jgi:surface antigen
VAAIFLSGSSIQAQPQPNVQPIPAPDLRNYAYNATGGNSFAPGQCTWYAWGRALEKLGVRISFSIPNSGRDAGNWYTPTTAAGISYVTGLARGSVPRPNSIAVWSWNHVAFVEDVDTNGNVKISEANVYPTNQYDRFQTLSSSEMQNRHGGGLLGYIYLTDWLGYVEASDCNSIRGWGANLTWLNSPVYVYIYADDNTQLGWTYANNSRPDVGAVVHDNGNHGFMFTLPYSLRDGRQHVLWARFNSTVNLGNTADTDLAYSQTISCSVTPNQKANLQFSVSPSYVQSQNGCYQFSITARELNGVGVNFSSVSVSPQGWSWSPLTLGLPSRLNAYGSFSASLYWCRPSGMSTWTITGTDDHGTPGSWSAAVTYAQ